MPDRVTAPVRPAIDYTNKDYLSLRAAMLDLAQYSLPEWTDRSPADPGVVLVELMAYVGDICLYYIDRVASECFLATAKERRSAFNLLQLIGYELSPALPASAELTLTFDAPQGQDPKVVTIPKGTQFSADAGAGNPPVTFEYTGPDRAVDLSTSLVVTRLQVQEGKTVKDEILGSSTGQAGQRFALSRNPVIASSVTVEVNDGGSFKSWDRRDNLLYHTGPDGRVQETTSDSRDFQVVFDEWGNAFVVFGDGQYGAIPPAGNNNLRATYRAGGGDSGNVGANTITKCLSPVTKLKSVTNPLAATGGTDAEPLDHAIRFAPLVFRSGGRAVTLNDYVSLAQNAGGVAKVIAVGRGWNAIDLCIAPEGKAVAPLTAEKKKEIIAYFEDKRMVGTFITIKDPVPAPVNISLSIIVEHNYDALLVRQQVERDVRAILDYKNVDFAKTIYLSKVYESAEAVPGAYAANVSEFRRAGVKGPAVAPDGRIQPGPFEIPFLNNLSVTIESERA